MERLTCEWREEDRNQAQENVGGAHVAFFVRVSSEGRVREIEYQTIESIESEVFSFCLLRRKNE